MKALSLRGDKAFMPYRPNMAATAPSIVNKALNNLPNPRFISGPLRTLRVSRAAVAFEFGWSMGS
jgi:hypothetical protein